MRNNIDPTMGGVYWAETSSEPPFAENKAGPAGEYDLAVVGAGYCGLSVALNAAKSGLSVLVLEAGVVGCGASGRNGGFVVPHFPGGMSANDAVSLLGKERGERLVSLVAEGPNYVFGLIHEHQIRCDAEQPGWIQPAHSQKSLQKVRRVFDSWCGRGVDVEWLDPHEIRARTGAQGYLGGWYCSTGGIVNPFALAQGLARVAVAHGAHIRQNEEVVQLLDDGPAKVLKTHKNEYRTRKVVFATNGYPPGLIPALDRSIIPIRLYHVFTRPLTEAEQKLTLPTHIPFTDLRKSGGFARLDCQNRLISGGAVFTAGNSRAYGERHAAQRIAEIFPHLRGIEIERYWEGYCALTDAWIPGIQQVDRNTYALIGFSTRGVALTQTLGREFAHLMAETKTEAEMPVRVGSPNPIAMQPLKRLLGGLAFPVFQVRDRLGLT